MTTSSSGDNVRSHGSRGEEFHHSVNPTKADDTTAPKGKKKKKKSGT